MKKRWISGLLVIAMLLTMMPVWEVAAEETESIVSLAGEGAVIADGTCGYNLTWTLTEDGVLTISGTGAMTNFSEGGSPWHTKRTKITSVVIEDGVTSIGKYAFYACLKMEEISIADTVTSIDGYAFRDCTKLKTVEIPDSVTSIGSYAFYGCSSLTSINIPDSVTSIGGRAFYGCSSLTSIVIPNSVTSIGSSLFYNCVSLTSVAIGDGVTSIGDDAFYLCTKLTSVNIPDGVTSIGDYVFYYCGSLTSINIPDGVTDIGEHTFDGCSSLTSINIPDSVTSIGGRAFYGCSSLWHVLYKGTEEQWNKITIDSWNQDLTAATRHYACTGEEELDLANQICPICIANCTHEWDAGVVTKEVTCTEDGQCLFTCALCGGMQTEVITAYGHNYESVVTEPTCTAGGYTTHTCANCGDSYMDSYTDPLPYVPGDANNDGFVDGNDAIHLLYYTLFGDALYPLNQPADFDGNGVVDGNDAIYLLYYTLFGETVYPLH